MPELVEFFNMEVDGDTARVRMVVDDQLITYEANIHELRQSYRDVQQPRDIESNARIFDDNFKQVSIEPYKEN